MCSYETKANAIAASLQKDTKLGTKSNCEVKSLFAFDFANAGVNTAFDSFTPVIYYAIVILFYGVNRNRNPRYKNGVQSILEPNGNHNRNGVINLRCEWTLNVNNASCHTRTKPIVLKHYFVTHVYEV